MKRKLTPEDMRFYKKLGGRYRELRLGRGIKLEDVVTYGFTVKYYEQLEAGRSHYLSTLYKLSAMFGVSAAELVAAVDK